MSNELRSNALIILEKWELLDFLNKYGKAYLVGSVELDLMTWRDIDIEIIATETPTKEKSMEIASFLFNFDGVRKVTPIDYRSVTHPKKPKGLYIGGEYIDEEKESWKIDIWYLTPDSANSFEKTKNIKSRLDDANKKIIKEIKKEVHDHPLYRKEIGSVDIYEAVLDNNIHDLEGFRKHLENKGILL